MTTENALAERAGEAEVAAPKTEVTPIIENPAPEPVVVEETPDQKSTREHSEAVQKRINSEVGKRKQAEAATRRAELDAAEAKGRADALETSRQAPLPVTTEDEPTVPGGRETFETDDDWLKAHKDYDAHNIREGLRKEFKDDKAKSAEQAEAAQKTKTEEANKTKQAESFLESVNSARANHEDYDDVVRNPELVMTNEVVDAIQTSDVAGEVAYHLASNPAEAERISKLSPLSIAREIGRIEVRLGEPKSKRTTAAPDPLEPITSGGETAGKDPDKMSMAEYEKWRYGSKS